MSSTTTRAVLAAENQRSCRLSLFSLPLRSRILLRLPPALFLDLGDLRRHKPQTGGALRRVIDGTPRWAQRIPAVSRHSRQS
jgi:hypothetical protein